PGHHPVPQSRINDILVEQARSGRRVVRLKGGDPFVFGRGGEEVLHCREAGVEVQVVPGVTSANSVPAIAGIPLTHRGVATSYTVATGHDQLAEIGGGTDHTVVVLMGIGTLVHSAMVLSRGDRGPDCPVAIIEDGFGQSQRVTIGTLGTIDFLAARRGVRGRWAPSPSSPPAEVSAHRPSSSSVTSSPSAPTPTAPSPQRPNCTTNS